MNKFSAAAIVLLAMMAMINPAVAQDGNDDPEVNIDTENQAGLQDAYGVILTIVRIVQAVTGIAALYYGASAGFTLVHAGENPQKAQEAKKTLVFSVMGIVLVLAAPFVLRTMIIEPYVFN